MKKLSIFLALLLAFSLLAVSVFAFQAPAMTVTVSSSSVYRGDTFTVTVSSSSVDSCTTAAFMFNYDTNVFEYVSGEVLVSDATFADISTANGYVSGALMKDGGMTVQGDLFKITLKVRDGADLGNYTISGDGKVTTTANTEKVSCSVSSATITVACNHSWDDGTTTKAPTCTDDGEITYTCSTCSETKTDPIPSTGHNYVDGTCSSCGAVEEVACDHTWVEGETVEPGLDEDGYTNYSCSVCGETKQEVIEGLHIRMTSATLMVDDIIKMRFTFRTNVTIAESMGILVYETKSDAQTYDISKAVWHEALEHNTGNAYYGFSDGIAAADMGTTVYVVGYLKYADGTYKFSQIKDYSPMIYCKNQLEKTTVSEYNKNLCKAMMHYGAAHQIYKNGGTNNITLMSEGFPEVPYVESVVTDAGFAVTNNEASRIKLASATMILEGAINYRIKFTISDATLKSKELGIEYTLMGKTYEAPIELEVDTYYAYINEVAARNMDELVYVRAYYVDDTGARVYFGELTYSGYIYAGRDVANNGNKPSKQLNVALSKALAMYIYYADVYFANK